MIISLYCKTVWLNRNVKKFEKKNVNSNILYIIFLSQLKLRILADFERLPIMKFNEYWCNNDLFCNVKDNILNVTFYWKWKWKLHVYYYVNLSVILLLLM